MVDPIKPAPPVRRNIQSPALDKVRPALPQSGATGNGTMKAGYGSFTCPRRAATDRTKADLASDPLKNEH
jgi:hypothetical protein